VLGIVLLCLGSNLNKSQLKVNAILIHLDGTIDLSDKPIAGKEANGTGK